MGSQTIWDGDYGRRWYQDLNSILLLRIRWVFLGNQIIWLFVQIFARNSFQTASYCVGVLPVIFFTTFENCVYFQRDFIKNDLNQQEWMIYRTSSNAFATLFLIIWLGVHQGWLLVTVWCMTAFAIAFENTMSCYNNNKCGIICQKDDYDEV